MTKNTYPPAIGAVDKNIPSFWLMRFYFIWVLIQVETISADLKFDVMALGHSGLLISWDPLVLGDPVHEFFTFICEEIPEKSNDIIEIDETKNNITSEEIRGDIGQYQISILNESTHYQINIIYLDNEHAVINEYQAKGKTGKKTNSVPQKSDLKWAVLNYYTVPVIRIMWLPCGKYMKCSEFVPSTHFAIRYKVLESKRWFESGDIYTGYYDIDGVYSGRIYEVAIISMNGHLKSDSYTTEEVFMKPFSGPVRDVKVMQLNSTSLRLHWKPPLNQLEKIDCYSVITCVEPNNIEKIEYVILGHYFARSCLDEEECLWVDENNQNDYEQIATIQLLDAESTNTTRVIIIPRIRNGDPRWNDYCGLEYSFVYDRESGKIHRL